MADDIVKRLLIKIGLDASEADTFLKNLQKQLESISDTEEKRAASKKSSQAGDAAASQAELAAAKQKLDTVQAQSVAMRQQIELGNISVKAKQDELMLEKTRLDAKQSYLKLASSEGTINADVIKQLQTEINLERQKLALQQSTLRSASSGLPNGGRQSTKEPEAEKLSLQGITRGLFGGGLLGSVAGGTLLGAGTIELIAQLTEKVKELGKALVEASGPGQQLRQEFEFLATGKGADPTVLIEKLRTATRGLVADTDLYRVSNSFMRANTGLTNDQMVAMIKNTTTLARATGGEGGVAAAMVAETRAFQTNRPQLLAHVAGLTSLQAVLRQIPAGVSPATRTLMEFQLVNEALAKAVTKVQEPITTLPELMTQVSVASKNFIDEVARGVLESNGFGNSIQTMSSKLQEVMPKIEEIAHEVGNDLGNALKFVVDHWSELKFGMEAVLGIKALDWSLSLTKSFFSMASSIRKAAIELGVFGVAEQAAGAGGKASLVEKVSKPLPGIGWGLGKVLGEGGEAGEAAAAVGGAATTAGEVGLGTAAMVAAPIALAGAAAGGLGYEAMQQNNLSMKQAKEGLEEWGREGKDIAELVSSEIGGAIKSLASALVNIFLPEWKSVWGIAEPYAESALTKLGSTAKTVFQEIVQLSPFGQIAKQLKAYSDQAEGISQLKVVTPGLERLSPEALKAGALTKVATTPNAPDEDDATINEKKKLAQLILQIKETELKSELDLTKQYISMEEEANKASYDAGLETFAQYQAKEKSLLQDNFNAQKANILQVADLKKKQLAGDATAGRGNVPLTEIEQAQLQKKQQLVDVQSQQQIFQLQAGLQQKLSEQTIASLQQQQAAYKTYATEVTKILEEGYAEQEKELEQSFKNGEVSADSYVAQRKALILEEAATEKAALDDELANSKDSEAEKASIRVKQVQVAIDAEKKLTELIDDQEQLRIDAAKNSYEEKLKILEAQQKAAQFGVKSGQGGGQARNEANDLRELIALDNDYIAQLKTIAAALEPGTKQWATVVDEIEKAKLAQQEYNQKLREMQNFGEPIAKIFQSISESFGSSNSKLGQFLQQMTRLAQQFAQVQKEMNTGNKGGFLGIKGAWQSSFGAKAPATPPLQIAGPTALSPSAQAEQQLATTLKTSGQQVTSWASTATSAAKSLAANWQSQIQMMLKATQDFVSSIEESANKIKGIGSGPGESPGGIAPTGPNQVGGGSPSGSNGTMSADQVSSELDSATDGTTGGSQMSQMASAAGQMTTTFQQTSKAVNSTQQNMTTFASGLTKAFSAVGEFASGLQAIFKSKTAASGAGSGALSMGMTGMSVAGPYGAAIGAVAGGIMGGIVGAKQQAVQANVTKIQTQLKSITDQLNQGTISLGSAIQQLQQERQQAVALLGGSKKGQAQLGPILSALNDQIEQLVTQQQQILQQLNQQLAVLAAPTGYSDIIDSLEQIIQKYQQFASAAQGNTAAVAQANQFLVDSLQQYAQTLGDQVNQAEQSAISDALQLIQLQQEAADMQNKLAEENFGILTQGVAARQQSEAQTKGQQIEANDEQYNQQMTQLNQEMALTQFKVTAQEKIFGLASDQNDLEAQMLQLQEQAATEQYKQVAAEVASLAELTSALANGGTLPPGLMNAVGGIDIQAILQLLGLGGSGGGAQLSNVPATYTEYFSALQNTPYSGIEAQLTSAASTAFGSSQRQQVEQELMNPGVIKTLQDAGLVASNPQADPNWINFANWIMNQAQAQPSYDVGGIVSQTGSATVHQGEYIMPNDLVTQFIQGLQSFSDSVTQFIRSIGSGNSGSSSGSPIGSTAGDVAIGSSFLKAHQQVFDLATQRVSMETTLLTAQQLQTQNDMQRLTLLNQIVDKINSSSSGGVTSFEGGLAQVYQQRGRYGSAGFRRSLL